MYMEIHAHNDGTHRVRIYMTDEGYYVKLVYDNATDNLLYRSEFGK